MDTTKNNPIDKEQGLALLKQFGIDKEPETEEEAEAMQKKVMEVLGIDLSNPLTFFQSMIAIKQENEKLSTDMALIMRVALDFIDVFGLLNAEKTGIRETIISGQEEPMAPILEQIIQIATIDAPMAKFSKRKREEMEQRFAFLGYMGLIVGKYPPAPKTIYADLKAAQQQP